MPDETLSGESSGFSPDPSAELDLGLPPQAESPLRRYRKKPTAVEAHQFDPARNYDEACDVVAWCGGTATDDACTVPTLEGPLTARPGDWIIEGARGEHWPVRGDVFAEDYEPVADDDGPALTRRVAIISATGGPVEVTPEAAAAFAEAGLFVGSAEDARILLSAPVPAGTFSDEVIAAAGRLAQAAGLTQ